MEEIVIIRSEPIGQVPIKSFWDGIALWNDNTHYVNRRLIGSKLVFTRNINEVKDFFQFCNELPLVKLDSLDLNEYFIKYFNHIEADELGHVVLEVFLLLPKNHNVGQQVQLCISDKKNQTVYYKLLSSLENTPLAPNFIYGFKSDSSNLDLWIEKLTDRTEKSVEWLQKKVYPKLLKWIQESEKFDTPISKSLSQVDITEYCTLYQDLKIKYAEEIIQIWPENTDPLKFVYEDVAIATYLILIWRKENRNAKQTFVDLGCGNGLLVYILNREGFPGHGIDVRARKIWKMYPTNVELEIKPIVPSSKNLFPNTDWLIGNHSDELTPWIPVIAARSSPNCKYFVLPCCPFDFDGKKYQRIDSSRSQYAEYLDYVHEISNICGFDTIKDKLRIPSTKRICLIGQTKSDRSEPDKLDKEIQQFINHRYSIDSIDLNNDEWVQNFIARPSIEKVRNCTKLDRNLITDIVNQVTDDLLVSIKMVDCEGVVWNRGGQLSIKEIVEKIPVDKLKKLKNECGGVQTLLKNHHYIFEVRQGFVQFRIPTKGNENQAKKTQCWFQSSHPQGCPLSSDDCRYKHT